MPTRRFGKYSFHNISDTALHTSVLQILAALTDISVKNQGKIFKILTSILNSLKIALPGKKKYIKQCKWKIIYLVGKKSRVG